MSSLVQNADHTAKQSPLQTSSLVARVVGTRGSGLLLDRLKVFNQLLIHVAFFQAHPRDAQEFIDIRGF